MEKQPRLNTEVNLTKRNHVGITVKNLDEAIKFYGALTGGELRQKIKLAANGWQKYRAE
jgi:predicted enzyme related to lactoylglutathione lyase